jgi:curved DNA-binding protein CbpA
MHMVWFKSALNILKRFKPGTPPQDSGAPNAGGFQSNHPEDLYARLGVKPTASPGEIRRAYRTRAKVFHPDVNPGDGTSEDAFKLVSEAFAILSDIESRRRYDESRQQQSRGPSGLARRSFPGQFARGFLAGMLTVSCLVPVILLVDAKRKGEIQMASLPSTATGGSATQAAGASRTDAVASQPKDAKGKEDIHATSATSAATSAKDEGASRETVNSQSDRESLEKEQIGTSSLKDVEAESGTRASNAETDAKQVADGVEAREGLHDGESKSPTAKLDGVEFARVHANVDEEAPVLPPTAPASPAPLPAKAGQQRPADPVIEEHVRSTVTRQISALRRRDGRAAFAIASPAVQRKFRDAHKFLEIVRTSYPDIPASRTASFLGLVRTRDEVIARFLLEGSHGRSVEAHYYMVRLAGRWRIDGCVIIPR